MAKNYHVIQINMNQLVWKMSIWSLIYRQQSVFKSYHSDRHFSEFLPTRWRQKWTGIDMQKLRHCHPMYNCIPCIKNLVKLTITWPAKLPVYEHFPATMSLVNYTVTGQCAAVGYDGWTSSVYACHHQQQQQQCSGLEQSHSSRC